MKMVKNHDAERLNPCLKEQNESYKCLDKNNYVHEKCQEYFDNYNICKKFWGEIFQQRRLRGIHPHMPGIEERAKIKQDLIDNIKNQKEQYSK